MEQLVPNIHADFLNRTAKRSPASLRRPGVFKPRTASLDQPRVRERIMKLSLVYSATCHHKYWSER